MSSCDDAQPHESIVSKSHTRQRYHSFKFKEKLIDETTKDNPTQNRRKIDAIQRRPAFFKQVKITFRIDAE